MRHFREDDPGAVAAWRTDGDRHASQVTAPISPPLGAIAAATSIVMP